MEDVSLPFILESYKIEMASSGHQWVPIVNGIQLHSMVDPISEARGIVETKRSQLIKNKNVLVFGLSFGYHVIEIAKFFESLNVSDYNLLVIDPNAIVVRDALEFFPLLRSARIKILTETSASKIYENEEFVNFLAKSPIIIQHPSTFNFFKVFYSQLMEHEEEKNLASITPKIKQEKFRALLAKELPEITMDDLAAKIESKKDLSPEELALMSFFSLFSTKRN